MLERTALGIRWDSDNSGRLSVLSSIDKKIFIDHVSDAVLDVNCIATCTANCLARQLNKNRLKKARYLLKCADCEKLASKISRNFQPDKSWLKKFCSANGIKVTNSQQLESARRSHCDVHAIRIFFDQFAGILDRDHRLIFNMDATMMASNRKFKVLVIDRRLPLVTAQSKFPHITACICFSAAGYLTKPLIIFPNKATMKKLEIYEERYHIASSTTGWMNHDIFFIWCLLFVCEMTWYRLSLPEGIRNKTIILIVDGHKSRGNYYAAKLLSKFNILLLILPGHTSHVLQAFDVGVASPLKTAFAKFLQEYHLQIGDEITITNISNLKTDDLRNMMIECFTKALDEAASISNIQSSFKKTGIVPVNPSEPLSNEFTFDNAGIYTDIRDSFLNSKCLNNREESLKELFKYEFKHEGSKEELKLSIDRIKEMAWQSHSNSL